MKKIILSLLCAMALLPHKLQAQSPQKMSYQAVIRDASDVILSNQNVGIQISILQGSASGTPVYVEKHSLTTNQNGLASFAIGTGTVLSGNFSTINWGNGPYFIKTETDPSGSTNYTIVSSQELMSVPYALFAANAGGGGSTQWSTSGNNISNSNSGNVGIGTSSPSAKLTIMEQSANAVEVLSGSNTDWAALSLGRVAQEANYGISHMTNGFINGSNAGDAIIRLNDTTKKIIISPWGESTTMVVANHKVGIGTNSPSANLDIAGNVKIKDGTQGAGKVLTSDANGLANWQTPVATVETDPQVNNSITNQVSKWNGTSLVDGIITDNGSNIGIGTSTPSEKLEVVNNSNTAVVSLKNENSAGYSAIKFLDNTSQQQLGIGFANNSALWNSGNSYINSPNNSLVLMTSDFERLRITPTGDIGIGTGTPTAKLHVAGAVKVVDGTQGTGKVLTSDANGLASWQTPSSSVETDPQVSSATANKIPRWNGTTLTDGIVTDNGTNVGIGTTSPTAKLTIMEQSDNAVEILSGSNTDWAALSLGRVAQEANYGISHMTNGFINGSNAGDAIIRLNDTTKKIIISPWGNSTTMVVANHKVGIGTNSPSANLDIAGNVKITDGTQGVGKVLTSDATGTASWQSPAAMVETDPQVSSATTNKIPKWNGTTLTDGIITDNGTKVGIGTTTLSAKLTIMEQSANAVELLSGSNTDWAALSLGRVAQEANYGISHMTNGFINGSNAGDAIIRLNDTTKKIIISPWGNSTTMVVANHKVGIGTNSPSANLDIAGNVKITDGTQGVGKVLTSDATGTASWQTPAAMVETDPQVSSATTNKIPKWNGTTLTDGIITDNGTKVGIGTTTLTAKLTIMEQSANAVELLSGSNTDWAALSLGRVAQEANYGISHMTNGFINGSNAGDAIIRLNDTTKKIIISPWGNSTTMVVANHKVGIGTNSPSANLDIAGNVKITDGTQGAGKVLTSDATGTATWQRTGALAYGVVSSTGTLGNNYGIASVTRNSVGNYTVTLSTTPSTIATVNATMSDVSGWGFVSAHYVSGNTITVICRNASSSLQDSNFNIVVYAP